MERLKGYLWNLSDFIDRLGLNQSGQPPLSNSVQPVVVVGDARELSSELLAPSAFAGGFVLNFPGQRPCIRLKSNAKGGTLIREFGVGATVANGCYMTVTPSQPMVSIPTTQLPQITSTETPVSEVVTGTRLGSLTATLFPSLRVGANEEVRVRDIYVPAGHYFLAEIGLVNQQAFFYLNFRDNLNQVPGR